MIIIGFEKMILFIAWGSTTTNTPSCRQCLQTSLLGLQLFQVV